MTDNSAKPAEAKPKKASIFRKPWVVSVGSSLISILTGLLLGFLVLVCINPSAAPEGFANMLKFGFTDQNSVANIFYSCVPFMMTALTVVFAFKVRSALLSAAG